MKKVILSFLVIFLASAFSSINAQNTPTPGAPAGAGTPAGAGDKNLSDELRKMNSIELERIKREADKKNSATNSTTGGAVVNSKIETKFPEIKEDFEGIQISQAAIIKTYTTDKKIDYALIEISAENINKHSKRLDSNMFAEIVKNKEKEKDEATPKPEEKQKTIRELIVELDNAIGSFVSSKIFANLRVIDPEVATKTRNDLMLMQELSQKLSEEAKKLK